MTIIGPVVLEIICLVKICTDGTQTEPGDLIFHTLLVIVVPFRLEYNSFFAYPQEVKIKFAKLSCIIFRTFVFDITFIPTTPKTNKVFVDAFRQPRWHYLDKGKLCICSPTSQGRGKLRVSNLVCNWVYYSQFFQ